MFRPWTIGLISLLISGPALFSGCRESTEVLHEHIIAVDIHGTSSWVEARAQSIGGSGSLEIFALAQTTSDDVQTAFLSCPPGSYIVSVRKGGEYYYYGSGTARPLQAQADPVVVGPGHEVRVALHFGRARLNLHVTNPKTLPEETVRLSLVTPVLRIPVDDTAMRYFSPVDEVIDDWETTVPPGRYRIRAETSNGQYSYLRATSRFGESDLINVSTSEIEEYTVRLAPPGTLRLHVHSPPGEQLRLKFFKANSDDPLGQSFWSSTYTLRATEQTIEIPVWPTDPFLINAAMDVGRDPTFQHDRWMNSYERFQASPVDYDFSSGGTADVYYDASTLSLLLDVTELGRGSLPVVSVFDENDQLVNEREFLIGNGDSTVVRISNMLPGERRFRISSSAGATIADQYYPDASRDLDSAGRVTLTGGEFKELEWKIVSGGMISGQINGLKPNSQWIVRAFLTSAQSPERVRDRISVNSLGFQIPHVVNGGYKLGFEILRGSRPETLRYYPGVEDWDSATTIEIRELNIIDLGGIDILP